MSTRYIPLYDENGDVLAPDFFVQGASVFAGEIGGGLDRDNIPANTIAGTEVQSNAFTISMGDLAFNTEDTWSPEMDVLGWQNGTGSTTGSTNLGILSWTADQDAHYDFYWSGTWSWDGAYSFVDAGTRPDNTDTFDTVRLRIVVDGIPICIAGPFEDGMDYGSTYMLGSIQLPAGPHTLKVECVVVRLIAQNGEEAGECTNTITFADRTIVGIGRMR